MKEIRYDYSKPPCNKCKVPKTVVTSHAHFKELTAKCDSCGQRRKLDQKEVSR